MASRLQRVGDGGLDLARLGGAPDQLFENGGCGIGGDAVHIRHRGRPPCMRLRPLAAPWKDNGIDEIVPL
jgi:hypothetical protein